MLGPWFSRTGDGKGAEDQIQVAPSPSAQEDSEQTAPEARYDAHVDDDDDDGSPSGNNFTTSHDTYLAMLRAPQPTASGKTVAETTQPETLFDPFTGADLGQLTSTGQPATRPAAREEVWAHLGRVLALQSEVARMHVQMESIGARAPEARLEATRRWGLGRTQSGLGIEGEEEEEEERRRERDEEFERLTGKFTGRKEGIDAIMNKLDEMSQEITAFHAMVMPTIDLSPSRRESTRASLDPTTAMDNGVHTGSASVPKPITPAAGPLPPTVSSTASDNLPQTSEGEEVIARPLMLATLPDGPAQVVESPKAMTKPLENV